jgi:hypothetical protein
MGQLPGTPLSWRSPRGSNCRPDPPVSSTTVRETRISFASARAEHVRSLIALFSTPRIRVA